MAQVAEHCLLELLQSSVLLLIPLKYGSILCHLANRLKHT